MIAIPVTVANERAQTGALLSMELAVTDPRANETKHFYSADFGRWTLERTRGRTVRADLARRTLEPDRACAVLDAR